MRRLLRRVRYVLRRRQHEADLAEEMEFHREMARADLEARGVDPAEASVAARRAFGSAALAHNRARDLWIAPWLQDLAQDVRFAVRLLRKEPAVTAAVIVVLGVGIGVNNTQFTIVDAMCIRGLPIVRPDRVVYIRTRGAHDRPRPLSYDDFEAMRSSVRGLVDAAAFTAAPTVVTDETHAPDRVIGVRLSADAFRLLGVAPALGRDFVARDDTAGASPVAIIGYALWVDRYGSDPDIIGRSVRIDGTPSDVIGVMPEGFGFPSNAAVWQPLAMAPGLLVQKRDARTLSVFGRMTDASSLPEIRAEAAAVADRLRHDHSDTNRGIRFDALLINDAFNANIYDPAWMAFTVVGILILVIASANAANLLLMRAVARSHEMAIRASLGASRLRLVRQLLVESSLLAMAGGLFGFALSIAGVRLFASAIPAHTLPYFMTYTVDARVLAVLVGGSAGTILLFGVAPAIHLARHDVATALRSGPRTGRGGVRAARWMTAFLTAEFALTMILLANVAVSVRSALAAQRAETVVEADGRLSASVTLPPSTYATSERRVAFYRELIARMSASAEVEQFALASALPLGGALGKPVTIEGHQGINGERAPLVDTVAISPGYFAAIGASLLRGRGFEPTDSAPGHEAAIVSQPFAEVYLPGVNAIGQRLRVTDEHASTTRSFVVVGVSPAVRQRGTGGRPDPVVYLPLEIVAPSTFSMIARTRSDPAKAAPLLRATVRDIDSDLPLDRVVALEQAMRDANWNPRLSTMLLLALTGIALGLSVIGLYAVTAHGVATRTREIGIRVALGARSREVITLVLLRAVRHIAYGFAAGIVCTIAWTRVFAATAAPGPGPDVYRLTDPGVVFGIAGVLALVAVLASVVPARRAVRVDPMVALRVE